mmetsp:Transcript_6815/g.9947  ORF Transcript_6815/g.9947 Transcript_6815/m.9947 type:complete len:180 (-) Transcript_6815:499-1038(-)
MNPMTDDKMECNRERNYEEEEKFMRMALRVGEAALEIGEVPVGCVIVLHMENGESAVVSHGANQVNFTRDATRHAEIVAIDRMTTGGESSDLLRLPIENVLKGSRGMNVPQSNLSEKRKQELFEDKWVNEPDKPNSWKNSYGWRSGRIYSSDIFSKCDLYVTCEPCIMVGPSSRNTKLL